MILDHRGKLLSSTPTSFLSAEVDSEKRVPVGQEWKSRKHVAMLPDKGFLKQLKLLKKSYEVVWDWGMEKWQIWDFPKNGGLPGHVATVQTKDRGYRELGADVLLKLQAGDPNKFSVDELCAYFDEMDNQVRRKRMKEFRAKIESIAHDTFTNIHCKIIQVPKEFSVARSVGRE